VLVDERPQTIFPKPINQRLLALRAGRVVCFFKNGRIGFVGENFCVFLAEQIEIE